MITNLLRAALFPLATTLFFRSVCRYVRTDFWWFLRGGYGGCTHARTYWYFDKKNCHEIRGSKKSMQKLGLAVDTGIGRDPFSDPVLSHFLHFFWKKFVLVEGGKNQL